MTAPQQQKLKITGPVAVTANRLRDGAVVYRTVSGEWATNIRAAAIVTTPAEAQALLAAATADDIGAVGAYVAPVERDTDGAVSPGNLRERIRQAGPTFDLPTTILPAAGN